MTTLYGIKNCDTVKKARQWLDKQGVDYHFHDFRAEAITEQQVSRWIAQLGWDTVINKRSTSWKQLNTATRDNMDEQSAMTAIIDNPTLVKRPLLDIEGNYSVGFKIADYENYF